MMVDAVFAGVYPAGKSMGGKTPAGSFYFSGGAGRILQLPVFHEGVRRRRGMPKTIAERLKVKFGDVRAGFAIFSREKGFCRKSVRLARLAAGIFQEGRANCDGRKRKTGTLCGFFDGEAAGGPNQEFAARPWRGRSCPPPQAAERFAARGVCGRFFHPATVGLWTTRRYSASFGASRQDFVSRTVPILIRCVNQSAFRLSKTQENRG